MEPRFTLLLAASFVILSAAVVPGVPASAFVQREAGTASPAAVQLQTPEKHNIAGKIESVDADTKTVRVEGTGKSIVVTDMTRYATGLSFSSLKTGLEVKIVAVARADGRMEALEVSTNS